MDWKSALFRSPMGARPDGKGAAPARLLELRVNRNLRFNWFSTKGSAIFKRSAGGNASLGLKARIGALGMIMSGETEQTEDFVELYRLAFKDYGCRALWNVRELENPEPLDALAITRSLRVEGDLKARRLAERIERACRVAL
jgi:hypothetical protein